MVGAQRPVRGGDIFGIAKTAVLAAQVATISAGARFVLLALIGLLLVVLGVLIAIAVVVRRRSRTVAELSPGLRADVRAAVRAEAGAPPRVLATDAGSGGGAGLHAAVPFDSRVACPTCGQEYDASFDFCPVDARELVPVSELALRASEGSSACVTCHRAFDVGVRYCPHDASELLPIAVYEATRGGDEFLPPASRSERFCPHCQRRVHVAARFCPMDGTELAVLH